MSRKTVIPLACGIASLALGVTDHALAAGVVGLCGVVIAISAGMRHDN
ncbi:hypothetical protein [Bifidobacterium sp. UTCIF-39]|nr:hypothetical protein [Bifidobacterium sp. UTCIF-39]